jgi:cell cycle checkpoint protein
MRTSRRGVVAGSSDEDEDWTTTSAPASTAHDEGDDETSKPVKGKLKSVRKSSRKQPTPAFSLQNVTSQKSSAQAKATQPKAGAGSTQTSPAKVKPTKSKAKAKPTVQDEPKPKAKPIYSFFNAATQRQQSSQRSASPMNPPPPLDQTETIDSEDENASTLELSKASSVALAMRKRKIPQSQRTNPASFLRPPRNFERPVAVDENPRYRSSTKTSVPGSSNLLRQISMSWPSTSAKWAM